MSLFVSLIIAAIAQNVHTYYLQSTDCRLQYIISIVFFSFNFRIDWIRGLVSFTFEPPLLSFVFFFLRLSFVEFFGGYICRSLCTLTLKASNLRYTHIHLYMFAHSNGRSVQRQAWFTSIWQQMFCSVMENENKQVIF